MNTFYLHDGQNEAGPFSVDELKKHKLTRNTPIRLINTDKWMPADKVAGLKEHVAPRKIKRPKDIVPAVAEHVSQLHRQKPKTLYGALLLLALLAGISFYSVSKTRVQTSSKPVVEGPLQTLALQPVKAGDELKNKKEDKAEVGPPKEAPKVDAAKAARLRWNKLVSAINSNYGIGLFGGIKNLSVIVNNQSDYPLNEVVANVTYIKANGGIWKTVPITLYAVPPHESKEQPVPDAGRGKKVKVSLYKVVSKQMKLNFTEGHKGANTDDPYYKEF